MFVARTCTHKMIAQLAVLNFFDSNMCLDTIVLCARCQLLISYPNFKDGNETRHD